MCSPYLFNTLDYMVLCSHYPVSTLYVGEYPYHPSMLPCLPSAFSYSDSCDTPQSVAQLVRFNESEDERDMVQSGTMW